MQTPQDYLEDFEIQSQVDIPSVTRARPKGKRRRLRPTSGIGGIHRRRRRKQPYEPSQISPQAGDQDSQSEETKGPSATKMATQAFARRIHTPWQKALLLWQGWNSRNQSLAGNLVDQIRDYQAIEDLLDHLDRETRSRQYV